MFSGTLGLVLVALVATAHGFRVSAPVTRRQDISLTMTRPKVTPRSVSNELLELYSKQITNELEASQLYLSASIWCDQRDLIGMAAFMRSESEDERGHALSFIDFANKRGFPVKLDNLQSPDADWATPEDLWEDILTSEEENTQSLLELGDVAASCSDHALSSFLMPFHMVSFGVDQKVARLAFF